MNVPLIGIYSIRFSMSDFQKHMTNIRLLVDINSCIDGSFELSFSTWKFSAEAKIEQFVIREYLIHHALHYLLLYLNYVTETRTYTLDTYLIYCTRTHIFQYGVNCFYIHFHLFVGWIMKCNPSVANNNDNTHNLFALCPLMPFYVPHIKLIVIISTESSDTYKFVFVLC